MFFPCCFFLPPFSSPLLGLEPGLNLWCLVLGHNEAQALDVSLQNFSERHSERKEVNLFRFKEKHAPRAVGHCRG